MTLNNRTEHLYNTSRNRIRVWLIYRGIPSYEDLSKEFEVGGFVHETFKKEGWLNRTFDPGTNLEYSIDTISNRREGGMKIQYTFRLRKS